MAQPSAILMELHYFPSVQFMTKFLAYEQVILERSEHYQKGSYRNRCHIAGANGLLRLSVPLAKGKNEQLPIHQTRIAYEENWQASHWHSIRSAYSNSPFFDFYADELSVVFKKRFEFLFDLNFALLQTILQIIEIDTRVNFSSSYQKKAPAETFDARNSILPKKHRLKEDPRFQSVRYPQVFMEKHGFLPNLSILDLLFCVGPQARIILETCILKL